MSIDFVAVGELINREIRGEASIDESMQRMIELCEDARSHHDWRQLRELPYNNLSPLRQWIVRPFQDEPPAKDIKGLWFGLFNPVVGGEAIADMYVCGSTRFDSEDPVHDWACDPQWWPEARYSGSEILADIYRIAYQQDGLGNDAEYPLCLLYACLAVRGLLTPPPDEIARLENVGVAVGYDSGTGINLGMIGQTDLQPIAS